MRIVIGETPRVGPSARGGQEMEAAPVEARLLDIRRPRSRRGPPPVGQEERRENSSAGDPATGKVLVLMIPDGQKIPRGVESGNYRIFLRFVPRRP